MKPEEMRFSWLFVFDLPVGTQAERGTATQSRTFLKRDGYMMIQLSIYARICCGDEAGDKHLQRVTRSLPKRGSVRALQVTDEQYGRMRLLLGKLEKPSAWRHNRWFCCDFGPVARPKSQHFSSLAEDRAYHRGGSREATAIRAIGAHLLFLPPYSPNWIRSRWSSPTSRCRSEEPIAAQPMTLVARSAPCSTCSHQEGCAADIGHAGYGSETN